MNRRSTIPSLPAVLCLAASALVLGSSASRADTVYLRNGNRIDGHIISQTDRSFKVETGDTTFDLPVSMIDHVIKYTHRDTSLVLLGDQLVQQQDFDSARRYYEQALQITDCREVVQKRLDKLDELVMRKGELATIDTAIKNGDYRAAGDQYQALAEGRKDDPFAGEMKRKASDAYCLLARQYYDQVRTDDAEFELSKAIKLDPMNPRAHALAGMIFSRSCKYREARQELELAKEIDPADPMVVESMRFLEQLPDETAVASGGDRQAADVDTRALNQLYGEQDFSGHTAGINYAALAGQAQPIQSVSFDMNAILRNASAAAPANVYQFRSTRALSIFLQAYNAGPGAAVMYNGNVPYTETVNYVQRVAQAIEDIDSGKVGTTPYDAAIDKYARQYGFHPTLIKAIVKVESDFNPNCVSHADARGLIQLVRCDWNDTMRRLGQSADFTQNVKDPEMNLMVGCCYLRWLVDECLPKYFKEDF